MSKLFQTVVNLQPVASLPGSGSKGDMVVLDSNGHLYVHNGSSWIDHGATGGGGGGGVPIYVGTTLPTDPVFVWFDTTNGGLQVKYEDGT